MKKLTWVLGVVLAVALTVGLTSGPATAYRPESRATFNVPKPWGRTVSNYTIVRSIEKAIDNTRPTKRHPRPRIHISTYLMDRSISTAKLIAACRRGVSVRVIMDEEIASRPSRRLMAVLNADNVRDRNNDGRADTKPKRGPCDTKLKKKKDKKKDKKNKKGDRKKDGKKKDGKKKDGKRRRRARARRARRTSAPPSASASPARAARR